MLKSIFDAHYWAAVPFHFWTVAFFSLGCIVGSFLNVCIHRLPLGESIVSPPSHCPSCKYSIPWYLNIPLATWLYLKGKCRNCGAPISVRYFLVELLTGIVFATCWISYGHQSVLLALIYSVFMSGLIAATFIDFAHFIIPDEITLGGMGLGFVCSFLVPALHSKESVTDAIRSSILGMAIGAGVVYGILRLGKLFFGRDRMALEGESRIIFTETAVHLPGKEILYEDVFYRPSDAIRLRAKFLELVDRCYRDIEVRLTPKALHLGEEVIDPETVPYMEAISGEIVLPREAMGLGDVKFMGAIGAFLGWKAVIFSLMGSSIVGSIVGIGLIATGKRSWSARLPYGPYIAFAAAVWIFGGKELVSWWFRG
jgi:leader peptidase (prepilin peptidase)/N-methyltransferase